MGMFDFLKGSKTQRKAAGLVARLEESKKKGGNYGNSFGFAGDEKVIDELERLGDPTAIPALLAKEKSLGEFLDVMTKVRDVRLLAKDDKDKQLYQFVSGLRDKTKRVIGVLEEVARGRETQSSPEASTASASPILEKPVPVDDKAEPTSEIDSLVSVLVTEQSGGRWTNDPISLAQKKLERIGAAAVEPLIAAMQNAEGWELSYVIEPLGGIRDRRAVQPLLAALNNSHYAVRGHAAEALGKIGDRQAVEPLMQSLGDEKDSVRWRAAGALGLIADNRAVDSLISCMKNDSYDYARRAAAEALGAIGDKRAVEALIDVALNADSKEVKDDAAEALEKIDPTAVGRLKTESEARAVVLDSTGSEIHRLMHSGDSHDVNNPIPLKGTEADVYYQKGVIGKGDGWVLRIPTASRLRKERIILIDPEANPDGFIFRMIEESPQWSVGTSADGSLSRLMASKEGFDYDNPIIIGDLAYVFFDEREHEWYLRVPDGVGERNMKVSEIPRTATEGTEDAVLGAISALGLSRMRDRGV